MLGNPKRSRRSSRRWLAVLCLTMTLVPVVASNASAQYRRGGFGYRPAYRGYAGAGYYHRGYAGYAAPRYYNRGYVGTTPRIYGYPGYAGYSNFGYGYAARPRTINPYWGTGMGYGYGYGYR